jgi:hypothetical protein
MSMPTREVALQVTSGWISSGFRQAARNHVDSWCAGEIRSAAVDRPDYGLSKFMLWVECFFVISIQQKNRRKLRKASLEC